MAGVVCLFVGGHGDPDGGAGRRRTSVAPGARLRGRSSQSVIAERGYDHDKYRRELWRRGMKLVIARRCTDHGSRLGRVRWVVERTFAWLHNFRGLRIRWERDAGLHYALLSLGCCDLLAPCPIVRHGRGRCSYAWRLLRRSEARADRGAGGRLVLVEAVAQTTSVGNSNNGGSRASVATTAGCRSADALRGPRRPHWTIPQRTPAGGDLCDSLYRRTKSTTSRLTSGGRRPR
jgi:transposase